MVSATSTTTVTTITETKKNLEETEGNWTEQIFIYNCLSKLVVTQLLRLDLQTA